MNSSKIEIPISMRWKVSKEEIQKAIQAEKCITKSFPLKELSDIKYYLIIFRKENDKIVIGLGIKMQEPTLITVKFKISVIPVNNWKEQLYERIFKKNGDCWGDPLCKYEEFYDPANNFFIDNYIYITLEGILKVEKEQICVHSSLKSPNNLGELLYNREDKDFDIFSENGKCVKVHKLIISAKSPVFERMILSGLKESKENKVLIIDFDFEIIELAIKFCYGISIANQLNVSNGIKLLQFSDKYIISDLKESMETYLLNEKSPMNICEIVNSSILMNSIKLREQCFDFILEKESKYINDLEKLDKEFALVLLKTSFSVFNV
uniref:BTB domain-containing protein n=1 Tax=Panagrolaimus davidi TaxID=227884 RepID=A0A914P8B7_9BILA